MRVVSAHCEASRAFSWMTCASSCRIWPFSWFLSSSISMTFLSKISRRCFAFSRDRFTARLFFCRLMRYSIEDLSDTLLPDELDPELLLLVPLLALLLWGLLVWWLARWLGTLWPLWLYWLLPRLRGLEKVDEVTWCAAGTRFVPLPMLWCWDSLLLSLGIMQHKKKKLKD